MVRVGDKFPGIRTNINLALHDNNLIVGGLVWYPRDGEKAAPHPKDIWNAETVVMPRPTLPRRPGLPLDELDTISNRIHLMFVKLSRAMFRDLRERERHLTLNKC